MILKALEEKSSIRIKREILNYRPRSCNVKEKLIDRKIKAFRTGDKFKIGSWDVEQIHVDYSVPGHMASLFTHRKDLLTIQVS